MVINFSLTRKASWLNWALVVALLGLLLGINACSPSPNYSPELLAELPEKVDFNFHIKPILSDRCFACHGPDENARKGNLRLDLPDAAFADMDSSTWGSHYAIRPGRSQDSEVYHRIYSEDVETIMPPPESNLSLSPKEKALLSRWIEQGAEWKPHWAFIPPVISKAPTPKKDWGNSIIDQWIAAKLFL